MQIKRIYKIRADGIWFVVAETEEEAKEKYKTAAVDKLGVVEKCIELSCFEIDGGTLTDKEIYALFIKHALEDETHEIIEIEDKAEPEIEDARERTTDEIIAHELSLMSDTEKREVLQMMQQLKTLWRRKAEKIERKIKNGKRDITGI